MSKPFRIALAGLGTVGVGVVQALQKPELSERAGRKLEVVGVSARDKNKDRGFDVSRMNWTSDAVSLASSTADVIVELIGGEDGVALKVVEAALNNGKHVVTGNKALLAKHGARLAALAEKNNVALKWEAAVAGGIPIVKGLRESLVAYGVDAVRGILNGTCNYILTQMEATGRNFEDVLKEAQALGYAEADPELDVGGGDTAHKLVLLASLAFGTIPDQLNISVEGITGITAEDIRFAREFGFRIKLLGIARRTANGIDQRVRPAMVKNGTPLAHVDGVFNAILCNAGPAGRFFFEGRGAGREPTTQSVVSDIVDIARGNLGASFGWPAASLKPLEPANPGAATSAYYLRFEVLDVPGVLAEIARHLAESHVSIESMIQRGRSHGRQVSIVMITHETSQASVERALKAIATSDKVRARPCMIPMEAA
ncbi:MAG: homoserine dehydrogenase [Alphaproteobacteria bacterium]|nr:homoserine dehydrogenase [Alphaproteobacteria bacterium]